jgi:hypothetical protein
MQFGSPLSNREQENSSSPALKGSRGVHLHLALDSWCTSRQYALLKRGKLFTASSKKTRSKRYKDPDNSTRESGGLRVESRNYGGFSLGNLLIFVAQG